MSQDSHNVNLRKNEILNAEYFHNAGKKRSYGSDRRLEISYRYSAERAENGAEIYVSGLSFRRSNGIAVRREHFFAAAAEPYEFLKIEEVYYLSVKTYFRNRYVKSLVFVRNRCEKHLLFH